MNNAVLFTGLPGIGLVGKIAVDYMLKQLKAEKIGEVSSDSFPPSVHTKNSLIELIKDELYHYSYKGKHYLFLAGPVQPSLDVRFGLAHEHYEFAREIVEAVKKNGRKGDIHSCRNQCWGEAHEPRTKGCSGSYKQEITGRFQKTWRNRRTGRRIN
ncbi:MAG: PAC2 family protein [archaeon]